VLDEAQAMFERARSGDDAAWSALVDRYGALVYTVARRAGLAGDDADEVFQTTWIQLHKHLALIREPKSLPGWIARTASREAWRVGKRRREVHDPDDAPEREHGEVPDDVAERLERAQIVRDALARLEPRCKELLGALFLEAHEPSYGELAARLGVPIGSLGPTRQRCLARLADVLRPLDPGGAP
jgi:RNA polymerase sigma factor (sigma-70 family)